MAKQSAIKNSVNEIAESLSMFSKCRVFHHQKFPQKQTFFHTLFSHLFVVFWQFFFPLLASAELCYVFQGFFPMQDHATSYYNILIRGCFLNKTLFSHTISKFVCRIVVFWQLFLPLLASAELCYAFLGFSDARSRNLLFEHLSKKYCFSRLRFSIYAKACKLERFFKVLVLMENRCKFRCYH